MNDRYFLPRGKGRLCQVAGALFMACALATGFGIALTGILAGVQPQCIDAQCVVSLEATDLLDADEIAEVKSSPAAERAFAAYVQRPVIRAGIIGVTLIDAGPFALMLLSVGIALRRMGGGGRESVAGALLWLRRASLAALAWAITRPLSDSLMDSLLSAGTPGGGRWQISLDLASVCTALLLGIAAFATVWALEAGLRAQRDLADFV